MVILVPILTTHLYMLLHQTFNTKYVTEGYFSRFIYGLDDTYFINLTGRYDASSFFHPDERWGRWCLLDNGMKIS
ncbi:MAG: hypothetical protein CM15mP59_5400 [Flavobacteriaceae bacterium]|nr:MAG: hypothetical protein CM15mP59_5400 [Flavobacteriaceae bacterium]